jgi:drug/metabolite transporter (DMT)-like permease
MVSATIGAFLSVAGSGAQLEILPTIGFWFMAIATVLNTAYNFANNALKRSYPDENANLFIYKASTLVVISIWAVIAPTVLKIDQPYAINLSPRLSDLFIPFLIGAFADGVGFLAFLKIIRLSDSVKVVIVLAFVAITQVFLAILFFKESASIFSAVFAPALVIIPTVIAGILDARTRKTKS